MVSKKCEASTDAYINLICEKFGEILDENNVKRPIRRYKWISKSKITIEVMTYGACITSIKVPNRILEVDDIVIGFDNVQGYLTPENQYFGCTVGRVANRIGKGEMEIAGKIYHLAINNGPNHLHGGVKGFDKVVWEDSVKGNVLTLSYLSRHMEEGYPGDLLVNISFELNDLNEFVINYKAMTTKPTIVNLTNHTYFNLAGINTGAKQLYKHSIFIRSTRITEVDDNMIPTGFFQDVQDTVFDFRKSKVLGDVISSVPCCNGFDHNFCLEKCITVPKYAARVKHPETGRVLEVYTDQPGIQFYTGNFLPENDSLICRHGYVKKHSAFCMETQNYPDAINHKNFPSPLLYPGQVYNTTTKYKFLTE